MKVAKIKPTDVSNGIGIRVSIFVSGCRHACKGCFNKEIWSFEEGECFDETILDRLYTYLDKEYIKGLTFLGGEPLEPRNQEGVYIILKKVKEKFPNKNIWLYSGFTYEYIVSEMVPYFPKLEKILELIDVLVDGKFEISLLDLKLKFRGSCNQRVIDMKKTRKKGEIIWLEEIEDSAKYIRSKHAISDRMDKLIKIDKMGL
ncbi:anaerobic ribonucleoside-triphosphate reductase activating protein [Streptobacillus moniliformis]|uniref:Anaerobic ribonucleoside-triphosphate reductase-activating protein n=1 Tax=Streptobacillus moniliformis (strain ATCC 14647 / DSM 12112 / NCTC 10651 / 9901) TaxID=519441 RepID=D1AVC6_STRM9|nr:anaerobic ribonucleoside-triphosphate reductase activating protein [Streptobacillus moniliformis]ACZ01686.1 anaerobic ribonucleoside-triphosphate reductase activating protein [Streptobacillus moniliformis DSM 12112]AVL43315.1 anaerobic ribonucleoside-triphosphate reductase activating protein [Streptobacillus moniliformis]SQA13135.1 anaerobic ribonucleotide reductase-activating protein [Streptobacillus moniliformis]